VKGPKLQATWAWVSALFLIALAPRLPDLGQFLTSDEQTNIVIAGSDVITAVLQGNLAGTYWHFYPGVTMSWADALGLGLGWVLARLGGSEAATFSDYLYHDLRELVVVARLPYVFLSALFSPALFLLLRRLFDPWLALAAALLVALDPFFLAHSRVAHGDMPVSVFMALSTLSLLLYVRAGGRKLLVISGLLGGLAALTKAPGQFMAPLVVVVAAGHWLAASFRASRLDWALARRWLLDLLVWSGPALALFVLLWPAMWVDPAGTVRRMLVETLGKSGEGHLVFFRGQPTLDPGLGFYLYVIPFRMTPLTSLGALISLGLGVVGLVRWRRLSAAETGLYQNMLGLWGFVILLLLIGNLSPKKQDRYLLPLFPILDVLAALGWLGLWRYLITRFQDWPDKRSGPRLGKFGTARRLRASLTWLPILALVGTQAAMSLPHHPYYLAYFNPMLGGLRRAVQTTLVGWGEGLEQAAGYLNRKPDAEALYVAVTPAQAFLPFFKGQGANFYTNDIAFRADYVVIYQAQKQRLAPSPEIVRYFEAQPPEHVVEIEGVPYAWIYPAQKLITADVPPGVSPLNVGLGEAMRLAGYDVQSIADGSTGQPALAVTFYWQALAAIEQATGPCYQQEVEGVLHTLCDRLDYTVSARLTDASGTTLVAQNDSWPAAGLLPTSQWRPGDYVRDIHFLAIAPGLPPGQYKLEAVVYEAGTGQVLGGPFAVTTVEWPLVGEAFQ
jgi:hypothetical protein